MHPKINSSIAFQAFVTWQDREIVQKKKSKHLTSLHKGVAYYDFFPYILN